MSYNLEFSWNGSSQIIVFNILNLSQNINSVSIQNLFELILNFNINGL